MLVITSLAVDRRKHGADEESGTLLSGGLFEGTWVGNLDIAGYGECDPMGNSKVTRIGIKL